MILLTSGKNLLANPDAKIKQLFYTLVPNLFSYNLIRGIYNGTDINWVDLPYIYTNNYYLHLLVKDDRLNIYNCLFIKAFILEKNVEKHIPFLVVPNLKQAGNNKEKLYEVEDNWLVVNLKDYQIFCAFDYTPSTQKSTKGELYDRHYHLGGDTTNSYVLRNVSGVEKSLKYGYKSLMSRGRKAFVNSNDKENYNY